MANNKGSLQLHKLILALTPTEKAYFKKYARQYIQRDTDYLRLFEELDRMKVYDDKALKTKFKNLSYLKNYLFNLLLDALANYYNNPKHTNIYLSTLLIHAGILEYKGFTKEAIKELSRGAKLAQQKNDPLQEYVFESVLHKLGASFVPISDRRNYFEQSNNNLLKLLQRETLQLRQKLEFNKLILLATQVTQGAITPIKEEDIDFSILENGQQLLDESEIRNYREALLAYYMAKGFFEKAYPVAKAYVQDEKKKMHQPGNDLYNYSQALTFCFICQTELKRFNEAEKNLEALFKIKSPNARVNNKNLSRYVAYKLILYSASRQFAKGAGFVHMARQKYETLYNPKSQNFHYHPLICYSLYLLFSNKNYNDCINLLHEADIPHIRKNALHTYKDMEMLKLMIQAELGNYKLLPNMVRSTAIKLKKFDLSDDYAKVLLNFFKGLPKSAGMAQKRNTAQQLDKICAANPHKNPQYLFMGVVFYQDWIKGFTALPA